MFALLAAGVLLVSLASVAALAVGVAPGLVVAVQCAGLAGGAAAGWHIITSR